MQNSQHTPGLPYSRPLKGEQLYEKLKQVFAQFADESVASKLIESVDSQRNEAVHVSTYAQPYVLYSIPAHTLDMHLLHITHANVHILHTIYIGYYIYQSTQDAALWQQRFIRPSSCSCCHTRI